jgi:hypothetical protein
VDIQDLSKILANYDKTFSAGGIKVVPEPSSIALLLMLLPLAAGKLARRRCRR